MMNEMQQNQSLQQQQQQIIVPSTLPLHSQQPSLTQSAQTAIQTFQINAPVVQMKIGNSNIPLMPQIVSPQQQVQHQHHHAIHVQPSSNAYNLIQQPQQYSMVVQQQIKQQQQPLVISSIQQQSQQQFVIAVTPNIPTNLTSTSPISSNSSSSSPSNSSSPLIRANSINNGTN